MTGLHRQLGVIAVVAVVAGNMLGSGIFFTPGELAAVAQKNWQIYFFFVAPQKLRDSVFPLPPRSF